MGKNIQRLGSSLASRMKKTSAAAVPLMVEFGKINHNLSLSVDSLESPITKGDYMVNIAYSGSSYKTSEEGDLIFVGSHSHSLPSVFRALRPGDRVLVVWVGFKPIVVSIIVKS